MKAEVVGQGIDLSCQVRTRVEKGKLLVLDVNGNVESSMSRERAIYPSPMRSAGIIPVDDAFVEFVCMDRFEEALEAVLRHSAYMVACGYGDSPEDVVEWFSGLGEADFIDGTSYKFVEEHEPFIGLCGVSCVAYEDDDYGFTIQATIREQEFEFKIESDKSLVSFILSTIPV